MRYLAWAGLRKDDLCDGPRDCLDARVLQCRACGGHWEPQDIQMPEPCPVCVARQYIRHRCAECPAIRLEQAMLSQEGILLSRAADLAFMLHAGFTIGPHEITAEEFSALQILKSEQSKYEEEQARRKSGSQIQNRRQASREI